MTHRQKSGLCQRQDILCNYIKTKYKHFSSCSLKGQQIRMNGKVK